MFFPGKLPAQRSLTSLPFLFPFLFSMPLGCPVLPQLWLLSPTVSLAKPVQIISRAFSKHILHASLLGNCSQLVSRQTKMVNFDLCRT